MKAENWFRAGVFAKINLTIRFLGTEDWFIGRMRESMEFQAGEECKKFFLPYDLI